MQLSVGDKLGPYEILAPIGEGGMSEVWKARDTRLNRIVAIKKLKREYNARFAAEARAIAALNHPNICQIYDIGLDYLVMEYVDGQPLRGPLALEDALSIAIQIAKALEEAHSRGILHRDLKPGNILVTRAGVAKLLDFGLAKVTRDGQDADATWTIEGALLGTAAYMAPEQAQGKPVDQRSDVFSFGTLLYEMLSGRRVFERKSMIETLNAVVSEEPLALQSPAAPVVERCLAKQPSGRFQSVKELREALELTYVKSVGLTTTPLTQVHRPVQSLLSTICPYRGLLYFREEDSPFFFGRDKTSEELASAIHQNDFVAVVGASGCGKSSVVRAGLMPRLRQDRTITWKTITMFPGENPYGALGKALITLLEPGMTETDRLIEAQKLGTSLATGEIRLRDVADRILSKQSGTDRLLLVVDQFEELYSLTPEELMRRRFIDSVLDASGQQLLRLVITLRGDFIGKALAYRPLCDRLQGTQHNLGPMTMAEMEQCITGPSRKVDLTLERGLVERLLDDAADAPGSLPLLEFVLQQLWEGRNGSVLSHARYNQIGGLQGALAKRAEDIFTQFSPVEQQTIRRVFTQMVRPGEDMNDTRRRASFAEIGKQRMDSRAKTR